MSRRTWDMDERPGLGWLGAPTPVVKVLLIANLAVFGVQTLLLIAGQTTPAMTGWSSRLSWWFGLSGDGLRSGWVWQLGSYMFLHSGIWHVLLNMLMLWMFGMEVEQHLGPRRFLRLYLGGGLVGAFCWLLANWQGPAYLVGASAAVSAVMIAFATLMPERPITMLLFFIVPLTMKAKWWAWVSVGIVAYSSLADSGGGVAHLAHLGGIVVGYVYVKWLGWGAPSRVVDALVALLRPFARLARRKPKPKELSRDEFVSQEVDPILDKIAREGIQSLTRRERKILEDARAKMGERRAGQ
ncbi:MAG: rhomboid family intramembrane serine protease [Verrucomicrobia bacterium]|nr:rhomboid family intramembrane serine protease [Verrucomicrobiota bacterium]